jgi:WD40 repeat protein
VHFWETASGREAGVLAESETSSAMFVPEDSTLLTCGRLGVKKWPLQIHDESGQIKVTFGPSKPLIAEPGPGEFGCLDARRERLAFIRGNNVHLLNLNTGAEGPELRQNGEFDSAAFSPDGQILAACSSRHEVVRMWATHTGEITKELRTPAVACVSFSPDGKWLVTASSDNYRFWDTASWKCHNTIERGDSGHMRCGITFSKDGRMAAIASPADRIRLIDPATATEFATLEAPELAALTSVCFTPGGEALAAVTEAGTVQLWDVRSIRKTLAGMKLDW